MKRTLLLLLGFCALSASRSQALPQYWTTFQQTYVLKGGTPLAQARCITCHLPPGPPNRNPYGKTVEQALKTAHTTTLTPAILHQIENFDADGDGWTNGEEIAAGTLPGDQKSHPSGTPPAGQAKPGSPASTASSPSPLFPLHSFHPQIVHFPIALYIFGSLLEGWGLWKRRLHLREAGFICLVGASVASLAAVTTGFTAFFRNGYPWGGTVLIHMILALSATVGMAVTALLGLAAARKRTERSGWMYWMAVVITLSLVSIAGHWGGMLVYG